MLIDQWAVAQNLRESFEDLSAQDINRMSYAEWAARTGRLTPAESAVAALDAAYQAPAPQGQQQPPAPVQEPQSVPQGITDDEFLAWRANRARGGEGRGIFDSVSRDEAVAGVRANSGRTAYSPEVHHPGISRVFVNANAQPVQARTSYYR
jgi:hypothetical protein